VAKRSGADAFEVLLTAHSVRDLEEIYTWIAEHDSASRAEYVLQRIESAVTSLSKFPERGAHPPELVALGIKEYRETFFKPYRVIYRVQNARVYIYVIADGRRDMQSLLARRLLGG
jgi:toxin ParE1/3/4